MDTPENSGGSPPDNGTVRSLGAAAWRHACYKLENMEFDGDMARYYADKTNGCQEALAAGASLDESRYIELLEAAVIEAQKEYVDLAEFHARRLRRGRDEVNGLLSASYDRS